MSTNQTNLEVVSRKESIKAKTVIKGNTATFTYDKDGNKIESVNFTVQRGEANNGVYENVAISGTFYGHSVAIHNNSIGDVEDDFDTSAKVVKICQSIMNPEPQEPQQDDTSV